MVRLRVAFSKGRYIGPNGFQFQDGAIKGVMRIRNTSEQMLFQFQDGAIKGSLTNTSVSHLLRFQFQDGAIKGLFARVWSSWSPDFNSKMVRLRVQ